MAMHLCMGGEGRKEGAVSCLFFAKELNLATHSMDVNFLLNHGGISIKVIYLGHIAKRLRIEGK